MPLRQMPLLEVDDNRLYHHLAILRYLAKKVGLSGESDWENLQIDIVVETINELRLSAYHFHEYEMPIAIILLIHFMFYRTLPCLFRTG